MEARRETQTVVQLTMTEQEAGDLLTVLATQHRRETGALTMKHESPGCWACHQICAEVANELEALGIEEH